MHEVLVNRLGGLSLPRKSVVRLTDRPDMTVDVYRGRKTTMQQQQQSSDLVSIGIRILRACKNKLAKKAQPTHLRRLIRVFHLTKTFFNTPVIPRQPTRQRTINATEINKQS